MASSQKTLAVNRGAMNDAVLLATTGAAITTDPPTRPPLLAADSDHPDAAGVDRRPDPMPAAV